LSFSSEDDGTGGDWKSAYGNSEQEAEGTAMKVSGSKQAPKQMQKAQNIPGFNSVDAEGGTPVSESMEAQLVLAAKAQVKVEEVQKSAIAEAKPETKGGEQETVQEVREPLSYSSENDGTGGDSKSASGSSEQDAKATAMKVSGSKQAPKQMQKAQKIQGFNSVDAKDGTSVSQGMEAQPVLAAKAKVKVEGFSFETNSEADAKGAENPRFQFSPCQRRNVSATKHGRKACSGSKS